MPHLAGWRAGLLLLLVLMLLLKPYMALVALYCCSVTLYSSPIWLLMLLVLVLLLKPHMTLEALYCYKTA